MEPVFTVISEPSEKYEKFFTIVECLKPQFAIPVERGVNKTTVLALNVRNITLERVSPGTAKCWLNFKTALKELDGRNSALLDETQMTYTQLLDVFRRPPPQEPTRIDYAEFMEGRGKLTPTSQADTILRAAENTFGKRFKLVLEEVP